MMMRATLMIALILLGGCAPSQGTVKERPDNMLVVYQQAMTAYQQGDLAAAEAGLKTITEHVPRDAVAWFRLGNIYARTNRPALAVSAYQEALIRDPEMSKAWHNMGVIQLRQAAKSFTDLQLHAKDYDPLKKRADFYTRTILELLDEGGEDNTPTESAETTATTEPGEEGNAAPSEPRPKPQDETL